MVRNLLNPLLNIANKQIFKTNWQSSRASNPNLISTAQKKTIHFILHLMSHFTTYIIFVYTIVTYEENIIQRNLKSFSTKVTHTF